MGSTRERISIVISKRQVAQISPPYETHALRDYFDLPPTSREEAGLKILFRCDPPYLYNIMRCQGQSMLELCCCVLQRRYLHLEASFGRQRWLQMLGAHKRIDEVNIPGHVSDMEEVPLSGTLAGCVEGVTSGVTFRKSPCCQL